MAIVRRELRSGRATYWVTFTWRGKTVWERAGSSRRAAESLEADRKREVESGTYNPDVKGSVTVASYLRTWLGARTNRTVENDRDLIERHVLSVEWFASMPIRQVRGRDCLRLVETMRAGGRLGEKSVATVYGLVRGAFRRAAFDEVIGEDPSALPRGSVRSKTARANRRQPYPRADVRLLVSDERILWCQRVWNALAFFTGMREGEVCGRRWRDWDRSAGPLTRLDVHSQYDDQPLKTDDGEDTRPRAVPVHPELAAALDAWWHEGFELFYRRPPTLDNFIVPTMGPELRCHTKSSAYKAFQRSLARVGVQNRTLHATRNTFISIARSGGAARDLVERITHNARGAVIDEYTTFEWRALCQAVLAFDLAFDSDREFGINSGSSSWTRSRRTHGETWGKCRNVEEYAATGAGAFSPENCSAATWFDASQRCVGGVVIPLLWAKSREWFRRGAAA